MYFNTTNLKGEDLKRAYRTANDQEQKIIAVFKRLVFPNYPLTPYEVLEQSGLNAPITSIRRAMTDLTKEGILEKTTEHRMGPYGKPSYCWRLKTV